MAPPKSLDQDSKLLRPRTARPTISPAPALPMTSATPAPKRPTNQRGGAPRLEGRQAAAPELPRANAVISSSSSRLRTAIDNLAQEGQPFGRVGHARQNRKCPKCGLSDIRPRHIDSLECLRRQKNIAGRRSISQHTGNVNGASLALPGMDLREPMPVDTIYSPHSSMPPSIIRAQKAGLVRHGTRSSSAMRDDTPTQSRASTFITRDSSAMSVASTILTSDRSMASLSRAGTLTRFGSNEAMQEDSPPSTQPNFDFGSPMAIASPSSSQADQSMGSAPRPQVFRFGSNERMREDTTPPSRQASVSWSTSSGAPSARLSADSSMRSLSQPGSRLRYESSDRMQEDTPPNSPIQSWGPGSPMSVGPSRGPSIQSGRRPSVARAVSNAPGGRCTSCGHTLTMVQEEPSPSPSPSPSLPWGSPMSIVLSPSSSQLSSSQRTTGSESSPPSSQDAAGCYSCQCGGVQIHRAVAALKPLSAVRSQFVFSSTQMTGGTAFSGAKKRR